MPERHDDITGGASSYESEEIRRRFRRSAILKRNITEMERVECPFECSALFMYKGVLGLNFAESSGIINYTGST